MYKDYISLLSNLKATYGKLFILNQNQELQPVNIGDTHVGQAGEDMSFTSIYNGSLWV